MEEKPKMDKMMSELEQAKSQHPTLSQRFHHLVATKTFKYATRTFLVAATLFSLVKFAPSAYLDIKEWMTTQAISSYESRFNKIKNEILLGDYASADTLITELERDMKNSGSPEVSSLLETIVAYDVGEIDPLLQRTAAEQATYQTQQAADLSALLTQQAIETEAQISVDKYLAQTEQAQPTSTYPPLPTTTSAPTSTLAPTPTETPNPTPTKSPTAVPTNPSSFYWIKEGVVGGSSLAVTLKPNQIIYLSASKWTYNGYSCSNDKKDDRMCVFVHQAKDTETVTLTGLISENAWYGITSGGTTQAVIMNRLRYWHVPPNCDTGCDYVLVRNVIADGNVISSNYKWDAASSTYIWQ